MKRGQYTKIIISVAAIALSIYLDQFLVKVTPKGSIVLLSGLALVFGIRFHAIASLLTLTLGLYFFSFNTEGAGLKEKFFDIAPIIATLSTLLFLFKQQEALLEKKNTLLQEEKADKFKITSNLAIQLKAISHVVNIGAQFLKANGNEFEKFDKAVEIISSKGKELDDTLEKIINLSNANNGQGIRINPTSTSLKQTLHSLLTTNIQTEIKSKGELALWDEAELKKAFSTLINASMALGTYKVEMNEQKDHATINFIIKSEFLTPSEQEEIPKPFSTALQERFKDATFGIKFAEARGIIEAHSGNLKVISSMQEGTIFKVLLPRKTE